ncbi:expressed unknown protein [Seminavis robusta]|uniref:Uncharacterized protein n=1 Tax=Seminavis robusta TaxID=568900 RepID=A0A9N8DZ49_9STRA|nr:expressed unknown protein [Seminavis robusta]|eukprot:Sro492_g153740.1 n/a (258) ;mRNA; f:7232-8005
MSRSTTPLSLLHVVVALLYLQVVGSFHLVSQYQYTNSPQKQSYRTTPLYALPKDQLLQLAKEYVANPSLEALADDFIFRGPVIGPLNKKDFAATFESVAKSENDIGTAFPDMEPNAFGFTADDPVEPNRVWYFVRPRGTFTGPFDHPVVGRIEPTGAKYIAPPEARSVIFNDEGRVQYQSVGYVTDRFTGDTTGGQGAVFGLYAVMGQELDDTVGSPVTVLLQKIAEWLPEGMVPKSYSKKEELPSWWKDERMGAQK